MSPSRLDAFRQMVAKNPGNALAQYGLANEAMKEGRYEESRCVMMVATCAGDSSGA